MSSRPKYVAMSQERKRKEESMNPYKPGHLGVTLPLLCGSNFEKAREGLGAFRTREVRSLGSLYKARNK